MSVSPADAPENPGGAPSARLVRRSPAGGLSVFDYFTSSKSASTTLSPPGLSPPSEPAAPPSPPAAAPSPPAGWPWLTVCLYIPSASLWHASGSRRDADEIELAEQLVVGRHLALALEDADRHRGLVVAGCREHLTLLGRDGGVLLDQLGEHAAERLDSERERRDVEQQDVL